MIQEAAEGQDELPAKAQEALGHESKKLMTLMEVRARLTMQLPEPAKGRA